jgi:c(7)-type cytochrome triheme protein
MKTKHIVLSLVSVIMCLGLSIAVAQSFGVKKKRPKPADYGKVVINNFSEKEEIEAVVFEHWLHRSKYTCRLCHVDIGFAMTANETMVSCEDNRNGMYCGSCHNASEAFAETAKTLLGGEKKNCDRCHSSGKEVKFEYDFYSFTRDFPRERFGNGIDWETAELDGLITLKDFLPGISIKRQKL